MAFLHSIIAWNVNGYTPKIHEIVTQMIDESSPSILFFTETKRDEGEMRRLFGSLPNYTPVINSHIPVHMHGVAMLVRNDVRFNTLTVNLNIQCRRDSKSGNASTGRIIAVEVFTPTDSFVVVGTYTPNSGGANTPAKLEYREKVWDVAFYAFLQDIRKQREIVWIGDANVAPDLTIDISLKSMSSWAGCRPGERGNFAGILNDGWIDAWRKEHPDVKEYTWRGNKDSRKYGMRIDHIIITPGLWTKVNSTFICHTCPGSDHVPVGMYIQL